MKKEDLKINTRRLPYVDMGLWKKIKKSISEGVTTSIKTYSRACTIVPMMVGLTIEVHNGMKFMPLFIVEDMVGRRLGEFVFTRNFKAHGGDKNKDRAKGGKK